MEYTFIELTIKELVNYIDEKKVDLNPDYQRNFIWSSGDQRDLVDTIIREYPIPNFFMYEDMKGEFEMVDGQQRSKTIYRFVKGIIKSTKNLGELTFKDCNHERVLNYRLPFVLISNLEPEDSLKDYYVLINRKGKHLNTPEITKSEFFDTNFLKLANEVLDYQNLINLNLFTEVARKRMNDRAFIEELLGYLKLGIKDKKNAVEELYENDISTSEYVLLKNQFYLIIDKIEYLNNNIYPIKLTRYRQKNDFYTFFNFVNENIDEKKEVLAYQYQILLILDRTDDEGRPFIRPSNEDCDSLKNYALNCVTQSNSKKARNNRLRFFNAILKNKSIEKNHLFISLLTYLGEIYNPELVELRKVNGYQLLDINLLN